MKVLLWTGLFLFLSSLTTPLPNKCKNYKNIREIVVIKLPHDLNTDIALSDEILFDSFVEYKDTLRLQLDHYKLQLGTDIYQTSSLDLRTKVIIYRKNGKKSVIMFDKFGQILFEGKVYSGSKEVLEFFRGTDLDGEGVKS